MFSLLRYPHCIFVFSYLYIHSPYSICSSIYSSVTVQQVIKHIFFHFKQVCTLNLLNTRKCIKHSYSHFHYSRFHWIFVFIENWIHHINHELLIPSLINCCRKAKESVMRIKLEMQMLGPVLIFNPFNGLQPQSTFEICQHILFLLKNDIVAPNPYDFPWHHVHQNIFLPKWGTFVASGPQHVLHLPKKHLLCAE